VIERELIGQRRVGMPAVSIVTLATKEMAGVWELARRTWEPYCERHGYSLTVYTDVIEPSLAPSWNKLHAVHEVLTRTRGPVWWTDADILVVDQAVAIEEGTQWTHDLHISQDWNGLCCALFRADNNDWTRRFISAIPLLGDVGDPDQFGKGKGVKWEQNAIKLLYRDFPEVRRHIGLLPPQWVNDRPDEPRGTDLFWHFGARSNEQRLQMMRQLHKLSR
jgi:hypothetical protein